VRPPVLQPTHPRRFVLSAASLLVCMRGKRPNILAALVWYLVWSGRSLDATENENLASVPAHAALLAQLQAQLRREAEKWLKH
jgi:hypothetical protein